MTTKSTTDVFKEKTWADLLIGDIIVKKDRKKTHFYKVTSIQFAACTPFKAHITVDGHTNWCEDLGQLVTVR